VATKKKAVEAGRFKDYLELNSVLPKVSFIVPSTPTKNI